MDSELCDVFSVPNKTAYSLPVEANFSNLLMLSLVLVYFLLFPPLYVSLYVYTQ